MFALFIIVHFFYVFSWIGIIMNKERFMTRVSVYLILENEREEILLSLRQNTGYADGYYGLVSGHVEKDETVCQAMIREAQEEVGISLLANDLHFVHVVQHKSGIAPYIDFYFLCTQWTGQLTNCESHKCKNICFFPPSALPSNISANVIQALNYIKEGTYFSSFGFSEHQFVGINPPLDNALKQK